MHFCHQSYLVPRFIYHYFLFSPYRDEEENIGQQEDVDDGDIPLDQQPSTSATDVVDDDDGNEAQTSGNIN